MKERIVRVIWDDAAYNNGYYDKEREASGKEFHPCRTSTVGHVVKSNKKKIILSHDRFYDSKEKVDDERHLSIIPRGMIRQVIELREVSGGKDL